MTERRSPTGKNALTRRKGRGCAIVAVKMNLDGKKEGRESGGSHEDAS